MIRTKSERGKRTQRRLELLQFINYLRRDRTPEGRERLAAHERKLAALDAMYGYTRTSRGNASPYQRGQMAGDKRNRSAELDAAIERRKQQKANQ